LEAKFRLKILVVNGDVLNCFDSLTQQDTLATSFFFLFNKPN